MAISKAAVATALKSKLVTSVSVGVVAKLTTLITLAAATGTLGITISLAKRGDFPAILVVKEPVKPATPTPVPTPTPTPVPAAAPRFETGINVAGSVYYSTERTFANLAKGASAWLDPSAGWAAMAADKLTIHGNPAVSGALPINVPQTVWSGKDTLIKCTWDGAGTLRVDGDRMGETYGDHTLSVTWRGKLTTTSLPSMFVHLSGGNAADPLRNLDCREPNLVANGVFDQRLVDDLKPYGVLRFLDWSNANGNPANVTWSTRSTLDRGGGPDGTAIEHMIDLANAAGSDAWFTVPYNADETYVRNMAKLVHDRLAPGHRAYFELSNEVWNFQFGVASQALNEGIAANLSSDKYTNNLLRYAEKSIWMHKLLTPAFADNPKRLVRVVSAQNDNPWSGEQIMGFKDTAQWVDAFATAPYFGHSFFDGANAGVTDLNKLFVSLEAQRVDTIARAKANKATADKYGKRFITYEGGQHIIASGANAGTAAAMQRSPLMYDMYKRYLDDWKSQINDTMTLYSATGSISQYGSWGIREYAGQPISETPKRRAALEYTRK